MRQTRAAVVCGAVLAVSASAAAQGIRTMTDAGDPIAIRTQVRHTTTVVVPQTETIVDVVAGDAEYWDVSASANVAYVKPLETGASSNVTLVAESGRVWALLVSESADADPNLVVYIDPPEQGPGTLAQAMPPTFVAAAELDAQRAEVAAAQAELRVVDEASATELAAVRTEHAEAAAAWLGAYPGRLQFPYQLDARARAEPFLVEGMWHDGRFTYLRSRAQETPALFELTDGEPALVAVRPVRRWAVRRGSRLGAGPAGHRRPVDGMGRRAAAPAAALVDAPARVVRGGDRGERSGRRLGAGEVTTMRKGLLIVCVLLATASGAAAQDETPRTVITRVRHVSTVILPATDTIVEVVAGDAEYWDVSAAAHLVFIRPLIEGAESNLVILTAAGAVIPLVVVERSDAPVNAVVRLGPAAAPGTSAVLAPLAEVEAAARLAADTWASVAAAEASAAERLDAAVAATQTELDADREAYPRRVQFAYQWVGGGEPRHAPFLLEGMWHDGERTYLRTRAAAPVLYEWVEGALRPVTVATVVGGVVYVVPSVLGPGVLEVGGERRAWSVATRQTGP